MCAAKDHVAPIHSYRRSGCRYSDKGAHQEKISVALSSAKAKYMPASQDACEPIWMRKILVSLFNSHLDPTMIHCDNQSCIKISINLVFHDRSKNIDIWYHHIRYCVQRKIMLLQYIPTKE